MKYSKLFEETEYLSKNICLKSYIFTYEYK
jgi:hypothetical protein